MNLNNVVNINITRQTAGISQAGFGTPLILGPNGFPNEIRSYSDIASVKGDFADTTPEYKLANFLLAQTPKPSVVKIGKTTAAVAQVETLTPDVSVQAIQDFKVEIDGVEYKFTSDATPTAGEVVTGLIALINADANCLMTAAGVNTLILTAKTAGVGSSLTPSANLTIVHTTANNGITTDIQKAIDIDDDWYALFTAAKDEATVLQAATMIEGLRKIYFVRNSDAGTKTNGTTDIFAKLKAKGVFRTAGFFLDTAADMPEAGFAGRFLPTTPGSETWAFKTLSLVTYTKLTDTEINNLRAKNANFYVELGGQKISLDGKVFGGEWIDIIRFVDWIQARMQEEIYSSLYNSDKIPFTDGGIGIVESKMRAVLEAGITAGGIDTYTVTVPKAKNISKNDKAARKLTGVKFTAFLTGAIHAVEINGIVTL